ncbi:MAG: carboxypeptidase regulatory-like domain-containing protein [Chloroflexota bacterium]
MSLTDSPKFEDELDNSPPVQPPSSTGGSDEQPPSASRRRRTRVVIGVLAGLVLITGLMLVLQRGSTPEVRVGSASIRGQVVDSQGKGVANAVVFVEGMSVSVTTGENGTFSISGVPGGQLVIVVGVTPEAPHFVTVSVGASDSKDVGQIVYESGIK